MKDYESIKDVFSSKKQHHLVFNNKKSNAPL